MHVYRKKVRGKFTKNFYVHWKNFLTGRWEEWAGYPNKKASLKLGEMLELISSLSANGLSFEPAQLSWVGGLEEQLRKKLEKRGLIPPGTSVPRKKLSEIVEHFERHLKSYCKPKHTRFTLMCVNAIIAFAKWEYPQNLSKLDVMQYVESLAAKERTPRTIGAHLVAIKSFSRWMMTNGLAIADPLATIKKPTPIRQRERRILLPNEWCELYAFTRSAGRDGGMSGEERSILYMVAIETGLRAAELASLTIGDSSLGGPSPYLRCRAACTKNSKDAKQHIRPLLATLLQQHLGKRSSGPVFGMTKGARLWDILRRDLAGCRARWIEGSHSPEVMEQRLKSDFLLRQNKEGEILDFHSLRHTCGAWLAMAGAHPNAIRAIMRHSSITLTMDTYGHLFPDQTRETITLFDQYAAVQNTEPNTNVAGDINSAC